MPHGEGGVLAAAGCCPYKASPGALPQGTRRLSKKWLAPLFRGFHSSLAPTARPGSYAGKPLLRKAFCGFDAHVAKSDYSLRGLRPPSPQGFLDKLSVPWGNAPGDAALLRGCPGRISLARWRIGLPSGPPPGCGAPGKPATHPPLPGSFRHRSDRGPPPRWGSFGYPGGR